MSPSSPWFYPGLVFAFCVMLAFLDWRTASRRAAQVDALKRKLYQGVGVRDKKRIRGVVLTGVVLAAFTWFVQWIS